MTGVVVCDDLIFRSKVTTTAKALGVPFRAVGKASHVLAITEPISVVLIDLHTDDLDIQSFVAAMPCPVIGFGSHVDVERLKAARAAGCAKVMPRSQFVELLETELANWAMGKESQA